MAAMIFPGLVTGTAANAASFSEREDNTVNEISKGAYLIELHLDNDVGSFRRIAGLLEIRNGAYAGVKRMHRSGPQRNRSWYVWVNPADENAAITVSLAHGNRLGEEGSITFNAPEMEQAVVEPPAVVTPVQESEPEPVAQRSAEEIIENLEQHLEIIEVTVHEEEEPVLVDHDEEDLVALESSTEVDNLANFGPWLGERMGETWFNNNGRATGWTASSVIDANRKGHDSLMMLFDPRAQTNFTRGVEPFWGATFNGNVYGAGSQLANLNVGSSASAYVGDPVLVTGTVSIRFNGTTTGTRVGEVSTGTPFSSTTTNWHINTGNNGGSRQFTATFGGDVATWINDVSGNGVYCNPVHWITVIMPTIQ